MDTATIKPGMTVRHTGNNIIGTVHDISQGNREPIALVQFWPGEPGMGHQQVWPLGPLVEVTEHELAANLAQTMMAMDASGWKPDFRDYVNAAATECGTWINPERREQIADRMWEYDVEHSPSTDDLALQIIRQVKS